MTVLTADLRTVVPDHGFQPSLFDPPVDPPPVPHLAAVPDINSPPVADPTPILIQKFRDFHRAHPEMYDALLAKTRQAVGHGHRKIGMKMLVEVLHCESMLESGPAAAADNKFVLCNNYTAYYARMIMDRNPDLAGVFEVRELRSGRRPSSYPK